MKYISIFILMLMLTVQPLLANVITIRWGINVDPPEYFEESARIFKQNIEQKTQGRIKVEIIVNEFEPRTTHHSDLVLKGHYQMAQSSTIEFEQTQKEMALWSIPFLFHSDAHVDKYLESIHAKKSLANLENLGLIAVGYTYSGGELAIYGTKPVRTWEDLSQTQVAMETVSPFLSEYWQTHHSITRGLLDTENFIKNISATPLAEVIASSSADITKQSNSTKLYFNRTNHRYLARILYINKAFLSALPKDLQKIVIEEARDAASRERQLSIEDKLRKLDDLSKSKFEIVTWDKKSFLKGRKSHLKLYKQFRQKTGSEILDKIIKMDK